MQNGISAPASIVLSRKHETRHAGCSLHRFSHLRCPKCAVQLTRTHCRTTLAHCFNSHPFCLIEPHLKLASLMPAGTTPPRPAALWMPQQQRQWTSPLRTASMAPRQSAALVTAAVSVLLLLAAALPGEQITFCTVPQRGTRAPCYLVIMSAVGFDTVLCAVSD